MSAAAQVSGLWSAAPARLPLVQARAQQNQQPVRATSEPATSVAFYRKHTENILRRYLYASMLVGRAPSLLGSSVGRGWASSRPIHTFEDAVIFVLDVEGCLKRLTPLERELLSRIVLQEYTLAETAGILGISVRRITSKLGMALDQLTVRLLDSGLLILPHSSQRS